MFGREVDRKQNHSKNRIEIKKMKIQCKVASRRVIAINEDDRRVSECMRRSTDSGHHHHVSPSKVTACPTKEPCDQPIKVRGAQRIINYELDEYQKQGIPSQLIQYKT